MQKILMSASLALAALTGYAATPVAPLAGYDYGTATAPTGKEWENPQAVAFNKEQPHAYFFPFATVDNAKKVLPEHSEYYRSLDGTWKFNWVSTPAERPVDFYKTDYSTAGWDDIQVPGCWNIQGLQKDGSKKYGTPIYVNQPVPFYHKVAVGDWKEGVMRTPPENWTTFKERNEVGSYTRTFTVPYDWKGRDVYINFDGVDSFFYLWINGQYAGFSKNSRNTASFNITPYLVKGENKVAVEVYRYSDGSFLESQDMFRLPGIIRSTYLTAVPKLHVEDMVVHTTIPQGVSGLRADGEVNVETTLRNLSNKNAKAVKMSYEVYPVTLYSDATGGPAIEPVVSGTAEIKPGQRSVLTTDFTIHDAKLWSAEQPNRYVLVGKLLDNKNKTIETVSTYFGVRQVEIRDTKAEDDEFGLAGRYFYVNNKPVKLKGVNRHEHNPATGHTLSREQMEHEIMLMKQGNINHVRGCHYADDPYWYIACDKYGIYLEDEANIESHEYYYGDASLSHVPEFRDAHVARNMEMVRAHVNNPSIVIWSLGNEAGPGQNFVEAYNAIKAFDKSRPVQYERNNGIVDMGSNQYPSIPWVREAVKGKMGIKYPFHISEYAHSMGNALGGFDDYWKAMESTNFFCGGAIWDWVDQSLYAYTPDGTRYMAYGGDFGDTPNDGMFCMNGIMFGDLTPKPQYAEVKKVQQNVGVTPVDMTKGQITVFNKNYFTTLDDLSPRWELTRNGKVVASGQDVNRPRMSVGPRESQNWTIPYDFSKLDNEGEYYVTLQFVLNEDKPWAKAGYVQAEEQIAVKMPASAPAIASNGKGIRINNSNPAEVTLDGDGWSMTFNNNTGSIDRLNYDGQIIITPGNGPRLSAYRAPVDNDIWTMGRWYDAGLNNLQHKAVDSRYYTRDDSAFVIQYTVESQAPCATELKGSFTSGRFKLEPGRKFGPDDFKFTTTQVYTVYPDGSVELQSAINSNKPSTVLPRLGYEMQLPSQLSNYTYYGRGPVNNFEDRKTGQNVGQYTSTVKEQFVAFPKPQANGNREGVKWNALTDNTGTGVLFVTTDSVMSASALPYTDMEMAMAPHPYQLPESKGTTLHLDAQVLGLGGASCGQGGPLTRLTAGPHTFGFIMRPMRHGADKEQLARVSSNGVKPVSISRSNVGDVTISSADPEAKLRYYIIPDNGRRVERGRSKRNPGEKDYAGKFNLRNGGTVVAWDVDVPELVTTAKFSKIEKVPVEVIFASAQEPGNEASRLVDGDPSTIWHSTYGVTVALYPHWVDFDCGEVKNIKGFTYLPRQDGANGDIKDWRIEVSNDNKTWTKVQEGSFANNKQEKKVMFAAPVKARYLRFTGLSSQNGADFAGGAEFGILAD